MQLLENIRFLGFGLGWFDLFAGLHHIRMRQYHAAGTVTRYPTQPQYPDSDPTSPWHVVVIPITRQRSNMLFIC